MGSLTGFKRVTAADLELKTPLLAAIDDFTRITEFVCFGYADGEVVVDEGFAYHTEYYSALNKICLHHNIQLTEVKIAESSVIAEQIRLARLKLQKESAQSSLTEAQDSDAKRRLEAIIIYAIENASSDIHIYMRNPDPQIFFRIDGDLSSNTPFSFSYEEISKTLGRAFNWEGANNASDDFNLKSIGSTTLSTTLECTINGVRQHVTVRLRFEKAPLETQGELKVVIRVSPATRSRNLEELGVSYNLVQLLSNEVKKPNGMIIVSGPTGSGKTTFLHGMLHYADPKSVISTIEDPVELVADYNKFIAQSNLDVNYGYEGQIKSLLRQDPDVIIVGEMRDTDTARLAIRASLTGHLVLTTLHTNSATGICTRLNDMGVSFKDLAAPDVLSVLMATRLAPKLCSHCKLPLSSNFDAMKRFSASKKARPEHIYVANPNGCEHCNGGVKGRQPIIEIVIVDDLGREFIRKGDIDGWTEYLRKNGWMSLRELAWNSVNAGTLDPNMADRIFKDIVTEVAQPFNYSSLWDN